MLDITSLKKALNNLKEAFTRSEKNKNDELLRDGTIQRFEYTYELAIKTIKRQLKNIELPEEVEKLAYRDLIRMGADKGLINNPQYWFDFRAKRNITSHTYDEDKAIEVYNVIGKFIPEAEFLIKSLSN